MDNSLVLPYNEEQQSSVAIFKNKKQEQKNLSLFNDNELSEIIIIIDNNLENNKFATDISPHADESKIKFHFLKKILLNKIIQSIKIFNSTLKKVKLMIVIMKINENMTNEIMNIKAICWKKNIEGNNFPVQSENNKESEKISFHENNVVNFQSNTIWSKTIIKFSEMFLSAMFIFVLELQPTRMSYIFDFYSRFICIFGFCGTLILLGNYINVTNNSESNRKLFNWDIIFCIFMLLSYCWLTFAIIFMYQFYITFPLSSLMVFGFLMQFIFYLDIKLNLICKRNCN